MEGNTHLIGHLTTEVGRSTFNIGISKKEVSSMTGVHISDQNRRAKRGVFDRLL